MGVVPDKPSRRVSTNGRMIGELRRPPNAVHHLFDGCEERFCDGVIKNMGTGPKECVADANRYLEARRQTQPP
jgi:hypothetical protein